MDILQKFGFYIGLGAMLLVYVLAYLIFVAPIQKKIGIEIKNLSRVLGQAKNYTSQQQLPNNEIVSYHERQKQSLTNSLQKLLVFFTEKDKELEKWFPQVEEKLKNSGSKIPELDFFQAVYSGERQELINKYSDPKYPFKIGKKTDLAVEVTPQERVQQIQDILLLRPPSKIVTESDMRKVQKEFWLLQASLQILEEGKLKTLQSLKINPKPKEFKWGEGGEEISFLQHSIQVTGTIEYTQLPTLISEIMNNKKKILIEINQLNSQRDKRFQPKTHIIELKLGETEEEAKERWKKENKGQEVVPTVDVSLVYSIFDYEEKK